MASLTIEVCFGPSAILGEFGTAAELLDDVGEGFELAVQLAKYVLKSYARPGEQRLVLLNSRNVSSLCFWNHAPPTTAAADAIV
jgi:hypothetical protein